MTIDFNSNGNIEDQLTNINVAKALIEHKHKYFHKIVNIEREIATFEVEDLEEIANHLLVYCNAERKRNGYDD